MNVLFNRSPLLYGPVIEPPTTDAVRGSIGLFRASMEDAIRFGGEFTRTALQKVPLTNGRKHVVVDVKVHMLMPGMIPAIPGFHTDGVPRPAGKDKPDIRLQEGVDPTIYHLLVTGSGCLTEFVDQPVTVELPDEPTPDLYKLMDQQISARVAAGELSPVSVPSCGWTTWDWWSIHRGIPATKHEWRYLIRVAETDTLAPLINLRDVLKTQQQVYVPLNYGW